MKSKFFVGIGFVLSAVASIFVASPSSALYHRPEIPEELLKRKK